MHFSMTRNQKIGIAVGALALLAFGAVKAFGNNNGAQGGTVNSNVQVNPNLLKPLGITRARKIADDLYELMRKNWTLSNQDTITLFQILEPVYSNEQFNEVRLAFGRRTYNTMTNNQLFLPFQSAPLHELKTWLKYELSEDKYNTLKMRYNKYL